MIHKCYYELFITHVSFSWFYVSKYIYYLNYLNNEMLLSLFVPIIYLFNYL
jgi:hypothetical protein